MPAGAALFFSFMGVFSYIDFRLERPPFSLSPAVIGLVFVLWVMGAAGPLAGRLADRHGWRAVALGGLLLCVVGLTLSLVPVLPVVVVGLALVTLGNFSAVTAAQLGVAGSTDRDRGVASAMYFSGYYVAGALGAYVPGLAWSSGTGPASGRWRSRPTPSVSRRSSPRPLPSPVRALLRLLHLRTARLLREHRLPALRLRARLRLGAARLVTLTLEARRALREPRGGRLQLARRRARGSCARAAGSRAPVRPTTIARRSSSSASPRRPSAGCSSSSASWACPCRAGASATAAWPSSCSPASAAPVTTGHADGVITLDLAESDDAHREALREQLGEPYRTVLGHFRHEVGHYYWPLLVPEGTRARALPRAVRRRARGLRRGARAPLRDRAAARLGAALRQRLRDDAPVGGLGGDLRPLPAHLRHAADRGRLRRARAAPTGPEPGAGDFRALLDDWLPLTYALNALSRSMGRDDLYPFVLPAPVVDKLAFVHERVTAARHPG